MIKIGINYKRNLARIEKLLSFCLDEDSKADFKLDDQLILIRPISEEYNRTSNISYKKYLCYKCSKQISEEDGIAVTVYYPKGRLEKETYFFHRSHYNNRFNDE